MILLHYNYLFPLAKPGKLDCLNFKSWNLQENMDVSLRIGGKVR